MKIWIQRLQSPVLAGVWAAAALTGCEPRDPAPRTFVEIDQRPQAAVAPATPSPVALAWTAPDGWTEESGGGMRLVSFSLAEEGRKANCNLIVLSGTAGGVEANIGRWMEQLELPPMDPSALTAFSTAQERIKTSGGFEAVLVDFSGLQTGADADTPSMLAGIISLPGQTGFFKMTGPLGLLQSHREAFRALCASLRPAS